MLMIHYSHCNEVSCINSRLVPDTNFMQPLCYIFLLTELKVQIEDYLNNFNEDALPSIFESILKRKLSEKHEDTDDELTQELRMKPLDNVKDEDFESDFETMHETDEEIDDLYNARDHVMKKMTSEPYFNMDDKKWDEMIKEAIEHGCLSDTRECEDILEDMLNWDKLLPGITV